MTDNLYLQRCDELMKEYKFDRESVNIHGLTNSWSCNQNVHLYGILTTEHKIH